MGDMNNATRFQPYDVLQINRRSGLPGSAWADFSTLRDAADFAHAARILREGFEECAGASFRVVRDCGHVVVAESDG